MAAKLYMPLTNLTSGCFAFKVYHTHIIPTRHEVYHAYIWRSRSFRAIQDRGMWGETYKWNTSARGEEKTEKEAIPTLRQGKELSIC